MKKSFKRISALVIALVMVMGITVTAFADEIGTGGSTAGSLAAANSVTMKKAITITNHFGSEGEYAYEPAITYTYTLSDGQEGGTINDGNIIAHYKAGLVSYLADGSGADQTAVFSAENQVTSGSTVSKDLTWSFDPARFPSAGVYRYNVNETAVSAAPEEIGIVRNADYDTDKYLDVYVKNSEAGGLEIYGYALVDDEAAEVTNISEKSQGWNDGEDLETYDTYNVTITKTITGAGADMTAEFPFHVELSGEMSSANIATEGTGDAITEWAVTEGTPDTAAISGTLGHNETIIIKGLPNTVTFGVKEDNPTPDDYSATAAVTGASTTALASNAVLAGSAAGLEVVTGAASFTDVIAVGVTNNLETISPTGLVLRFAPYILILGAGILLLVLSRRRQAE